jgi:hypothetical protein
MTGQILCVKYIVTLVRDASLGLNSAEVVVEMTHPARQKVAGMEIIFNA